MFKQILEKYMVKDQCSTTLRENLKEYKAKYKDLEVDTYNFWMRGNLDAKRPNAVKIFFDTDSDIVFLKAQKSNEQGRLPGVIIKEIRSVDEVEKNVKSLLDECKQFLNNEN